MKKSKKNKHCCDLMDKFTEDPRIGIGYSEKFREYYINLIHQPAVQGVFFCPFCGDKLPLSLRDLWFEILEKNYKINDPWDEDQEKLIPKDFETDKWWKKRDLKPKKGVLNLDQLHVKDNTHCCKLMSFFIEEQKVAIYYNPIVREYYIRLWSCPVGRQVIYFCPWCGYKFIPSLIEKFFQILKKEYKILYCDYYPEKYFRANSEREYEIEVELPREFKSDEWWQKRGL